MSYERAKGMSRANAPVVICFALLCALLPGCVNREAAPASPGVGITNPREYDAFWRIARYADLFSETLRADGRGFRKREPLRCPQG
jgi:hypothetical protein